MKKNNVNMKTFLKWLMYSSSDATKISLTMKNFAVCIPMIVATFAMFKIQISESDLIQVGEYVVSGVTAFVALMTAFDGIRAFAKKIKMTKSGTNDVLNNL